MDEIRNPYVPNAGAMPPALVGREVLLEAFSVSLHRLLAAKSPKSVLPYGLRGVGKTVLMNRFVEDAEKLGYYIAIIEADENVSFIPILADQLRRILFALDKSAQVYELAKRALRILKSFTVKGGLEGLSMSLGVDVERGFGDSGDLTTDLTALILAIAEAAREQGTGVLIAIDEVQYIAEAEFSALIKALHAINQKALPLIVVATGLPQILAISGEAKSYAERIFNFQMIGALDLAHVQEALSLPAQAQGVVFEEDAGLAIFEYTSGYPFFIQEWAYRAWNCASGTTIRRADVVAGARQALAELDQGFFRVRYERCTDGEKRYLRALAEIGDGPYRTADVAKILRKRPSDVGVFRDALLKKGMVWSPKHGEIDFSVPLFADYMRRTEPNF